MQPTQVVHPWQATARTVFQALVAFAALWPIVVVNLPEGVSLGPVTGYAAAVTVGAAFVTRIMAVKEVNDFIGRFLPWLAAPKADQ